MAITTWLALYEISVGVVIIRSIQAYDYFNAEKCTAELAEDGETLVDVRNTGMPAAPVQRFYT